MRIGELAASLALNPKTIRYYEQQGLLPTPLRTSAGYRSYHAEDQDRLRFIVQAKLLGLSLREISAILAIRGGGEAPCRHVVSLIDQKLAAIEEQVRALTDLRRDLRLLRREAKTEVSCDASICPIIEHHHSAPPSSST